MSRYMFSPSRSFIKVTNCTDDELRKLDGFEIIHLLRSLESDYKELMFSYNNVIKRCRCNKGSDFERLVDANQRIHVDNKELRDLCYFLDDDRQRGQKLAREWQRFGKYTASVMKFEVSAYQLKLQELEKRQELLIKENRDLKQLCLYLDQEFTRNGRDEGDGSSNSTTISEARLEDSSLSVSRNCSDTSSNLYHNPQLGNSDKLLPNDSNSDMRKADITLSSSGVHEIPDYQNSSHHFTPPLADTSTVLNIPDNLNTTAVEENERELSTNERAVVRQMCNVVWRKLGNAQNKVQQPP